MNYHCNWRDSHSPTHNPFQTGFKEIFFFFLTEILQYHLHQKLQTAILKLPLSRSLIWGPLGAPPYMQVLFSLEHLP